MEAMKLYQLASRRGAELSELYREELWALDTGFKDLDEKTGGIRRGDFVVIGARPGMGGGTFIQNLVYNIATRNVSGGVLLFSAEMNRDEIVNRLIAEAAEIDGWRVRTGAVDKEILEKIEVSVKKFDEVPLYIDDTTHMPIEELVEKVRRVEKECGLNAVVIDGLGLLLPYDQEAHDYEKRLDEATHGLNELARELEVPIILRAKIPRYVRDGGRLEPDLESLRQYGALEKDASMVIFLHRPGYYENDGSDVSQNDVVELIIRKNVHGPLTKAEIKFDTERLRFVPTEETDVE